MAKKKIHYRKLKMLSCLAFVVAAVFAHDLVLIATIALGSFGALRYAFAS